MSWEEMSTAKHPCPCGKSTYTITDRMDDWNRTDSSMHMDCEACRSNYVIFSENSYRSSLPSIVQFWISERTQAEYVRLLNEAKTSRQKAKEIKSNRYLSKWKNLFEGKNKKQAWVTLTNNGARYPALGTFYQHTKTEGVEAYLVRHFENADDRTFAEIMTTLEIDDVEVFGLIELAKQLECDAHDLVWRERVP